MGKWFINTKPTRNTEKDEEKDKLNQQLSDPLHQKQERKAESIIQAPQKSIPENKSTDTMTNTPEIIQTQEKAKSDIKQNANRWYVTEGRDKDGVRTRTFESEEARRYRLGDYAVDTGHDPLALAHAWEQTDQDQSLFDRFKQMKASADQDRKFKEEAAQSYANRQQAQTEGKLTELSDEERDILDKYNSQFTHDRPYTTEEKKIAKHYYGIDLDQEPKESKAELKDKYMSLTGVDEETFDMLAHARDLEKNAADREADQAQMAEDLKDKSVAGMIFNTDNAASVFGNTLGGIPALVGVGKDIADDRETIDTNRYTYNMANQARDYREAVSKELENRYGAGASFAYQTGMSVVDSTLMLPLKDVGLAMMGTTAAANSLQDAQNRGLDRNHALATAAVAGAAEIITEKISIDKFFKILNTKGAKVLRSRIGQFLSAVATEGGEELGADVLNTIGDFIINADQSEFNQTVKAYMDQGATKSQATKQATNDLINSMLLDLAGGAIAGGIHAGIALTGNRMLTSAKAKEMFKDGSYKEFAESIDDARETYKNDEDWEYAKEAKSLAQQMAEKHEAGEKITTNEQTRLLDLINETTAGAQRAQMPEEETLFDKLANRFNELVDGHNAAAKNVEQGTDNVVQSTDNVAQNTDNAPQKNRRFAPVQSDITAEEAATRMSQARTADELGAIYNEAKNSTHEDARRTADRMYDVYAGKLQSQGITAEELRRGRISEQEAYEAGRRGEDIGTLNPRQQVAYNQGANDAFKEESALPAKDAKATTNSGTEIEVSKIVDTTEGKIETSDGKVLPMTDIHFNDRGMQKLYNAAMEYHSPQTAQLVIESYPAGSPVGNYITNANRFYMAGQLGRQSFEDVLKRNGIAVNKNNGMTEEAARKLYNAGKEQGQATKSVDTRPNKVKKVKGVVNDNRTNKTDTPIKKFANAFALKFGIDIDLSDQMEANVNGMFQKNASRVVLNIENDNLWNTLVHEIGGEFTLSYNENGMEEIQNLILEYFIETQGEDWLNDKIKRYQNAYQKVEGTKSVEDAYAELVNDALAGIFSTPEGMTELAEWLAKDQKNNVQTNTVLERIARWIQDLIDSLKKYISSHPNLSEASQKTLQMEADRAAGLRARIMEEWQKAIDNYNATEKVDEAAEEVDKHSIEIKPVKNVKENDYTYKTLTSKQPITVKGMADLGLSELEYSEDLTQGEVNVFTKKNIEKYNNYRNNLGNSALYNKDLGGPVSIGREGITHGLNRMRKSQIEAIVSLPAFFENAIVVNEADGERKNANKAYIMFGVYDNGDGLNLVRMIVNHYDQGYSVNSPENSLYAVRIAKKEDGEGHIRHHAQAFSTPSSKVTITQLLNYVKEYFPNDLSKDVANHLIYTRKDSDISGLRYSLDIDSEGKKLSAEQQEYFKDSKIRDNQGRLITVYHGTPYGGFTVFKNDLNYFTPNQEYAERYHSPSASSIRGKYDPATNEMTYKGYLNITHPFDITDPKTREVFINDYVKGGWSASINPSLSDAEIEARISGGIDWTEADNIKDFIDENELDYDGIILDEGAGGGYGQEVEDHGISYVTFNSNQFKNTDNENPTEDPDIRYSINIDDDRVFYAGNTEVVKNPTSTEYAQMREDVLNEYPWLRGTGEPLFRHTFDEEGNEYYWEANSGLHSQIEPQINRRYNTRTSQQYQWWTKEDKDDYPVNYERYYSRNEDNRFSLDVPIEETDDLIAIHNLSTEQMMETLKLGGLPMPSIAITRADMGHNMYGNISVLFHKDTIDPRGSRYNKVYSGDAYTPEFPSVGYKINSDKIMDIRQQVKDLIGEEYELFTNTGLDTDNAKDILERNSGNVVDGYGNKDALKYAFTKAKGIDIDIPTREENLSSYYDNDVIKYLALMFTPDQALHDYQNSKESYKEFKEDGRLQKILDKINSFEKKKYSPKLYEKVKTNELEYFKFDNLLNSIVKYLRHGVETKLDRLAFSNSIDEIINNNRAKYEAWLNDLFDGIIEKKGIRNNKDMFTPSGNRRKWESLYDDFTLMNIVNAMRKEDQTGKGFGGYSFFGSVNREFESIDDIRSEKDRLKLIDQDEYSNLQKEIANELHDIAVRLKPGMGYDEYSIMSDIAEAVAKRKTRTGVKSFLSQWYKVSDEDIADIMELAGRASKLPTGYFEAKPQRAVGLDEIASVVVPDLETDLIDELKDKKIPYKTYKAGDKESRKKAVNSVEDIRFSLSGIDTDILNNPTGKRYSVDDDWMDEFTSMTDEELEQMVRETIIDDSPNGSYTSYRANIDQTVENLSRMLEAANAPLRGHEVNRDRIAAIADQIKDHYSSHISKQVLTDNLVAVFDYLQHNDNIDYNDITRVLSEVAAPVLEKTDIDVPEEYARFKDLMRGYKIKLTDKQKQELANIYGSYETARKQNFGRLTFSDDGYSLDSIWSELVEKSAGLLNEGAYEGEQITQLIDAMDICSQGHSVVEVERGQDLAQASIDLTMEIMEEYYKAEAEAIRSEAITGALESGMAGKAAKETIDRARAKMQEQQKEFRKKTKEEYETRIKYLEKQLGDIDYYKAMAEYNEKVRNIHDQKSQAEIHRLIEELAKTRRQMATQAKALNKNSVEDYKESQERIKARKEITRLGNNLMNRILNPTTKQHVPTDLQKPLADFLSGIDFVSHRAKEDSKSTKSWREKMQSLSIYLSQLEAGKIEDDVDYLSVLDPDLNSDIRDFIKETEGYAKVSQLDTKELQKLESILKRIQASINKVDKALANQQYERVSDLAVATRDELRDRKPHKATYRGLETLNSFFNIAELDPTSYFYEMGEAAGSIMQSFRDGFDKRVWHLKSIQDYVDGIKNEVGLKNFADWRKEEHTFKTNEGELTLTTAQIMSLYCLMNRDQAREHIVRGGLKAGDREKGFLKKSVNQLEPIHITPEEYSQIVNTLTNDQKYIASKLQQYMATECAKWGNNVSRALYGYEKFTDKNYFPIDVDKNTAAVNDKNTSDTASMWGLRNKGFTKDLAPHAKNAVILNDIFSVFTQHTTEMATYDGLVLPLTDAMRWYNFRAVNEVFTEANDYGAVNNEWNIQREIERVLGKPGQQYFTKLIKDINGMNRTDGLGVISKFMGNYKAAAVAANMRVVIQQPTAYARAFAEMDARDLTAALASAPLAGKYAKKAQDNCAIALWKAWGFYETYMGQSMEQIITGDSTVTEKIRDIAAIGAQKADDWTWGILWRACEIETSRLYPNMEYNSTEYLKAVAERMSYVVDRTQVVDSVLHRSDIMRRQDGLAKTFTAFMAEPTKSVNMLHRALVSKDKKKLAKAIAAFLTSNLLVAFFAGLIDAARHDDDEHSYQELLLEAFKKNAMDNLNPINLFPYVKDLYAILETTIEGGYQSSNTDMSLAGYSQTVQAMWNIYKYINPYTEYTGKKTPYGLAKDLTRGVSQLTGIPAYNLWRDIEAGHNMLAENWATTTNTNYGALHKAITSGEDIEGAVNKMIEDGVDPGTIKKHLTSKYKEAYIEASEEDRAEMKEKLLRAYNALGDDSYDQKIDGWVNKAAGDTAKNDSQDSAPVQEYTSDYAGVYQAIDQGGNIQAEVQSMLASGKEKSGVKSAITRHYKDDYLSATGSDKANLKNTLIKAYTAAGYSREEAISTIEGW